MDSHATFSGAAGRCVRRIHAVLKAWMRVDPVSILTMQLQMPTWIWVATYGSAAAPEGRRIDPGAVLVLFIFSDGVPAPIVRRVIAGTFLSN